MALKLDYIAPRAVDVITRDRLIDTGTGDVVARVDAHPDLRRDDGTPAQAGDVLSVQPDGTMQTRAAGTAGNFERAKAAGSWLVYRPVGTDGRGFCLPLASDWPNK